MKKAIKDLHPGEQFIFDDQEFLVHHRYAGKKLNVQCLVENETYNLFADSEMLVDVLPPGDKTDIEVGDKISVVCKNGHSSTAIISSEGRTLFAVEKAIIEISPNELVKAKLTVRSTKIATDAVISEINISNGEIGEKLEKVKKIIDSGLDGTLPLGQIYDDLVKIFYPKG